MAERPPCRLAALGVVSCLGSGPAETSGRLVAGDASRLSLREDLAPGRALWVGAVREALPAVPPALARYACRNNALSLAALAQIEESVAREIARFGPGRVGLVIGTSTSGVGDAEAAIAHHVRTQSLSPTFFYDQLEFGGAAGFLATYLGLRGPAYTLSTACSSGARALASARSLLALGLCDAVIAGATDSLCGLTAGGFGALQAIAESITNPMSANRSGITLGEASALFLLTRESGGIQLLGAGESSEAHHMSAPDPEGRGAREAMEQALADAGLAPAEIAYLNLHGTGTPLNDAMESVAVAAVFGTALPCSSTKPLAGHTLGAAGALEAALCWLVLRAREDGELPLPPHVYDGVRDPSLPTLHLVAKGERARLRGPARVMTNSFGFGGNNCTLVLGEAGGAVERVPGAPPAGGVPAAVRAWSAWAPGLESAADWERWAREPAPLAAEGVPDARFLPAMLRRRCTPLTRIMLRTAFDACPEALRGEVRTVFASRHGSINESIELIECVARGLPLSPAKFSHTVHNAQAALFSIAATNRRASSSLAAQEDTFGHGWLEALAHLEREPERPVLLVMGDVPLAPTFAPLVSEPVCSYAVAWLLAREEPGEQVSFSLAGEPGAGSALPWPSAVEWLRAWLAGESALEIAGARQRFRWERP
jgi:3-oxoacyl-[acyl-carrier-protein] synthase I